MNLAKIVLVFISLTASFVCEARTDLADVLIAQVNLKTRVVLENIQPNSQVYQILFSKSQSQDELTGLIIKVDPNSENRTEISLEKCSSNEILANLMICTHKNRRVYIYVSSDLDLKSFKIQIQETNKDDSQFSDQLGISGAILKSAL